MNISLHKAARSGRTEEILSLIQAGADINAKDGYGRTPLHHAFLYESSGAVSLLLSSGADIKARDRYGETPLHLASRLDYPEEVSFLISSGADVGSRNVYGKTPLHYAVRFGQIKTVSVLMSYGADIDVVDIDRHTPVTLAIRNRRWDIVAALGIQGEIRVYEEELKWPVHEYAGYLVIGCQIHRIEEWRTFSDDEISVMDEGALPFWKKHGPAILAWADCKE